MALVSLSRSGKDERFVLTGFAVHGKGTEASDAIKTGIAQYSFAPEFSYFRNQVGAVLPNNYYGI